MKALYKSNLNHATLLSSIIRHVPGSKKTLLSVGKSYHDGINVHMIGIECYITDSKGHMLGLAEHMFP